MAGPKRPAIWSPEAEQDLIDIWGYWANHASDAVADKQLREIELEENENRKPLTQGERERTFRSAKKLVDNARRAEEVLIQTESKPASGPT